MLFPLDDVTMDLPTVLVQPILLENVEVAAFMGTVEVVRSPLSHSFRSISYPLSFGLICKDIPVLIILYIIGNAFISTLFLLVYYNQS